MKTFKKLFSVSAIVALLGTLAPFYAFGATYSDELQEAYEYAYAKNVTTMTSIDNANMYGSLTRIAMAKMIANYATTVLNLEEVDNAGECTFSDVTASLDAQYDNGVTNACKLGLMGQNITAFRPNDPVTRGEFGTTLSRALNRANGNTIEEGTPYYENHLAFLKSEGIMNDISNPSATEVRGYVMLMMMRADDGYVAPSESGKCTLTERVDCILNADDTEACIAACSGDSEEENTDPEEVKAGTLNVTMTSEEGGEFPSLVSSLPVATYTLKAADEDINVTSLVIQEGGYATAGTIKAALFIDGQRVSKVKTISTLNKDVTLNLTNSYTIKAGKSVDVELRAANITAGAQQFNISLSDVNSSAEKVKLPSNVKSNTFKLLGTNTKTLTVTAPAALEAAKVGTKGADLFEIKLQGDSTQNIEVNSITLVASNKDVADYFENFELTLDGETLANGTMNGKYLTFNLDTPYVLEKDRNTKTFVVKGDVIGGAGKGNFNFTLEDEMDLAATAVAYNAPVDVAFTPATGLPFSNFSANAGRVTIERTNPSTTTFVANRTNVFLGSFTISDNNGSDLSLTGFTLTLTKKTGKNVNDYVDTVKVRYGSSTAGFVDATTWTAGAATFTDEQKIGKNLTIYVYADIENTGVNAESFQMSLSNVGIVENENDTAVTDKSMPASWLTMKGSASEGNVTNIKLGDKSFARGAEGIDAVSFKIKTNSTAGIKVKNFAFSATGYTTGVNANTVRRAVLFAGNDEYTATIGSGTIKVNNAITLDADTTTTFTLKVDLASNPEETDNIQYVLSSVEAEDTTADRNIVTLSTGTVIGRIISVIQNGTLAVTMENTDNNKYAKSILAGTDAVVAEYQLKANYETVTADKITLTFAGATNLSDRVLDVELAYGDVVLSDAVIAGTTATFSNAKLKVDTTKAPLTVTLKTKTINGDNGTGVVSNANISKIAIEEIVGDETGNPINSGNCTTASKAFDIVPATIVATVASTSNAQTKVNLAVNKGNNELDNDDLTVTFTGFTLEEVGGNGSLTGAKWTVINPDNTTGSYVLAEGDNEFTINYIVSSTANNLSYTVNMKDVKYITNATSDLLSNRMQALQLVSR